MKAWRKIYERLPSTVDVPAEFAGERVEVILLGVPETRFDSDTESDESVPPSTINGAGRTHALRALYGAVPDMPDRNQPGDFDERANWP